MRIIHRIGNLLLRKTRRVVHRLRLRLANDFVLFSGARLPPRRMRFNTDEFRDDRFFLDSSLAEADRLIRCCGLSRDSELLEIGCATGRLAIGLQQRIGAIRRYVGIDIIRDNIVWCRRFVAPAQPGYRFIHWNMRHERYNPHGQAVRADRKLPLADRSFDIIYLYGVAANLLPEELSWYLREFNRLIRDTGTIFFTAFVEENVPPWTINPEHYVRPSTGKQNIVRYEKGYLTSLIEESGFRVNRFDYGTEYDRQSGCYLSRAAGPAARTTEDGAAPAA